MTREKAECEKIEDECDSTDDNFRCYVELRLLLLLLQTFSFRRKSESGSDEVEVFNIETGRLACVIPADCAETLQKRLNRLLDDITGT